MVECGSPTPLIRVRVLVPVLMLAASLSLYLQSFFINYFEMGNLTTFLKNSWEEVTQHVTWPSYSSLQSSASLVLVASLIFAVIVGLVDFLIENGLRIFYDSL